MGVPKSSQASFVTPGGIFLSSLGVESPTEGPSSWRLLEDAAREAGARTWYIRLEDVLRLSEQASSIWALLRGFIKWVLLIGF